MDDWKEGVVHVRWLDEATSALDSRSERMVQDALSDARTARNAADFPLGLGSPLK